MKIAIEIIYMQNLTALQGSWYFNEILLPHLPD